MCRVQSAYLDNSGACCLDSLNQGSGLQAVEVHLKQLSIGCALRQPGVWVLAD